MTIRNFGRFSVVKRILSGAAAFQGEERMIVTFTPAAALKESVNEAR